MSEEKQQRAAAFRAGLEALELGSKGQRRLARITGTPERTVRDWVSGKGTASPVAFYVLRVLSRLKAENPTLFEELTADPEPRLFDEK